jgi:hypothetical protein
LYDTNTRIKNKVFRIIWLHDKCHLLRKPIALILTYLKKDIFSGNLSLCY